MGLKSWETPPWLFNHLDNIFHFTVDAASSDTNCLVGYHWTPRENGLVQSWLGHRVFCNPPYDNSLYDWVRKASSFEAEVALLVLPANTDPAWFHDFIWDDTHGRSYQGVTISFCRGRVQFLLEGRPGRGNRGMTLLAGFSRKDEPLDLGGGFESFGEHPSVTP